MEKQDKPAYPPDVALVFARVFLHIGVKYGEPERVEYGLQLASVARASIRRGLTDMPWVPRLPFPQPDPPEMTDDHRREMHRKLHAGLNAPPIGRQPDLFIQRPQGDLFDR